MKYDVQVEDMTARIEAVLKQAVECVHCDKQDARRWYAVKGAWIREHARRYGLPLEAAFPIYSLLSANATVPETDRQFLKYCRRQRVDHFPEIKQRIRRARRGHPHAMTFKNAAKLSTFAINLRYPKRPGLATIDRWSARIAIGNRDAARAVLARSNLRGYRLIESAYVEVAERHGMLPNEVQALTWVHVVDLHGKEVR